jgi:protein SCO1/2
MTQGRAAARAQTSRAPLILGGGAALILCAAALILVLASPGPHSQPDQIGGPFTLTADDGRTVTNRSFPGKYLAIYFGYTNCQDVCPATLTTLTAALSHMGNKAARIQPLFITIDPARDTPDNLHRYVRAFSPTLIGLTGPPAALQKTADEYRVISIAHGTEIDHSSVIYLVAPDGNYLAPIPADASEMVLAQAMARYVK